MDNIFRNKDGILLKEGDLIEGEILEIIGDRAILNIKELGTIKANIQGDLSQYEKKYLKFTIKAMLPNKIEITPIVEGDRTYNLDIEIKKDEYLTNILKEFDIQKDPISIEFLDSLIKYNVSINRNNLENGIRILDKLEQIINITQEEVILPAYFHEKMGFLGDEDIRNFLIQITDENNEQLDVSNYIKEQFSHLLEKETIDSNLIKTIAFFVKYEIKPSIKNINYFLELVENPYMFFEDYKVIETLGAKEFTKYHKKAIIKSGESNIIEQNIIKHKITIEEIVQLFKYDKVKLDKNIITGMEELQNKLDFLQELREHLNIIFLPLIFDEIKKEGYITLIKDKRKNANAKETINIYIKLQTNKLGIVDISLKIIDDKINILFNELKEEDIILFKNRENLLKEMVDTTGYKIDNISYSTNKGNNILDHLIVNPKPVYNLDVQV